MSIERIAELEAEVKRLEQLVSAANKHECKVLSVEMADQKMPPTLVITAPGMDERRIASYLLNFYTLYFETLKSCCKDEVKRVEIERRTYRESEKLAKKFGHKALAAEFRRIAEHAGTKLCSSTPTTTQEGAE